MSITEAFSQAKNVLKRDHYTTFGYGIMVGQASAIVASGHPIVGLAVAAVATTGAASRLIRSNSALKNLAGKALG